MVKNLKLVLIVSGKRKSGKDFVVNLLLERFKDVTVIRIAEPIKLKYAQMHGADFKELLSSSSYKEVHRLKMVTWSEQVKMEKNDPVYFLKEAIEMWKKEEKKIWIISDARRVCDVEYFKSEQFKDVKVIAIRITASEETRKNRKWTFTENIDDAQTECGLDNYKEWDYIINNDGSLDDLKKSMQPIFEEFKKLEN